MFSCAEHPKVADGASEILLQVFGATKSSGIPSGRLATPTTTRPCVSKLGTQLIAAGGIMDLNGIQAALRKGAQAVQMGTAFLACHEAGTSNPYRAKLLDPSGRKTRTTRVFSGRLARGMENRFVEEMQTLSILPFPAQNSFTRDIRSASAAKRSADFLSLWSGTGKGNLWQGSVAELIERLFPRFIVRSNYRR